MELTPESVRQAVLEVREYRNDIVRITKELGRMLVDSGVDICRMKITQMDAIETGELLSSVEGVFDATVGRGFVRVGAEYAFYVEYGTGVYVDGLANRKYGEAGWYYYDKKQGNRKRWTKGERPRPFMYETFVELCNQAQTLVETSYD